MEAIYFYYFIRLFLLIGISYTTFMLFFKPEFLLGKIYNQKILTLLKVVFILVMIFIVKSLFITQPSSLKSRIEYYNQIVALNSKDIKTVEIYKNEEVFKTIKDEVNITKLLIVLKKAKLINEKTPENKDKWKLIIRENNNIQYIFTFYKIHQKKSYLLTLYLDNYAIGNYESNLMDNFLKSIE